MANKVRGEIELPLTSKTYTLKPEHDRAVKLDDALPLGVLGTLLQMTDERSIKLRTLATIIHHLSDEHPGVDAVMRDIVSENFMFVAGVGIEALRRIASGSGESEPGEDDGLSDLATGSIGLSA